MIRTTVLELLEGNPQRPISDAVQASVDAVADEFDLAPLTVRVTKVGPKLYVEVEGTIDGLATVTAEHEVRQRLYSALDELPYDIWLNMELLPDDASTADSPLPRAPSEVVQPEPASAAGEFGAHDNRRRRWWPLSVGAASLGTAGWAFTTAHVGILGSNPAYLYTLLLTSAAAISLVIWALFVGAPPQRSQVRVWLSRCALVVSGAVIIGLLAYLRPMSASQLAVDALDDAGGVSVEVTRSMNRLTPDAGPRPVGLAFYPGARVDPQAYTHLLRPIAEAGYEVVIFKQPYNLAILDSNAADAVIGDPDDPIDTWVIAGHSLGGAMAARYAESQQDELVGLLLYAAYPVNNMSERTNLAVMSVFGTADAIADPTDIEQRMSDLPPATEFVAVDGAIHSFFGDYGIQRGDGNPTVSREQAQREIADASIRFLATLEAR
jgi:pimeloyl-ACP methyl ester carboxylesterase